MVLLNELNKRHSIVSKLRNVEIAGGTCNTGATEHLLYPTSNNHQKHLLSQSPQRPKVGFEISNLA